MTVAQLIEIIKDMPQDERVFVDGYEDGFDEVSAVRRTNVKKNPAASWYNGGYTEDAKRGRIEAVLLFSRRREKGGGA